MKLTDLILEIKDFKPFISGIQKDTNSLLTGIGTEVLSVLIETVQKTQNNQALVVMDSQIKVEQLTSQLQDLLGDQYVYNFPVDGMLATRRAFSSPDELASRISTLDFLLSEKPGFVVTTPEALEYKLSPIDLFKNGRKKFVVGKEYPLAKVNQWLINNGFVRDQLVVKPGEFALRGDILDIYPFNTENPIRMEFFGDELDAIKTFDMSSQRSINELGEVEILPATDRIFVTENFPKIIEKIEAAAKKYLVKLDDEQTALFKQQLERVLVALSEQQIPENVDFWRDYLLPESASIVDYLASDATLYLNDINAINKNVKKLHDANEDYLNNDDLKLTILPKTKVSFEFKNVIKNDHHAHLYLSLFQKGMGRINFAQIFDLQTRSVQQFFGQMPLIKTEITRFQQQNQTIVIQANNKKRQEQISQTLSDFDVKTSINQNGQITPEQTQVIVGKVDSGFLLPQINLVYLTEKDLFNQHKKQPKRVKTLENAQKIRNYNELKPGDFVVHVNHGIGRFEGIKTLEVDGKKRDYITITYQKHVQLFIPADQLGLVQKYTASEGKSPKINKLGGTEWAKTKRSVAAKIEDIADDLVDLYAKRKSEKGFQFSPDNDLVKKFEAAFPYPETPDQLQSVIEIKKDMERPIPMDRLLVGDVGFGKTEVALRAAFKAAQDGKQTAILVPTTILAQQHFETMQERFKDFPINLGILSRFQSKKQINETLEKLANGEIDIVVGTHRILSKDVKFHDLGLLVVDEEQRFGVKHKERIKELKAQVDVLTLTATPIPRTLNMSMVGVRDLSVIETPPSNRYPIQTYVSEFNDAIVREAILREMARGGQTFYLHNRIDDIEHTVFELNQIVPEAKIGYIHGRMTENQLENILLEFMQGKFDVLVTTTIIETGVDMPNVNTLIVEDADRYGLSQLYQLRGRVGRSSRIAYAYFLYQQNKVLTEVGEKRLTAIKDFTELGSGFKIAMRDLSIRGAGNMLGKQQHGFIDSVGYDLYAQMLDEAIKKKSGQKIPVKTNSEIELDLEAYIPDTYIEDQRQKIEFYKRIKDATDLVELDEISDELLDRFGDYNDAVENLIAIAKIKLLADLAQVEQIREVKDQIKVVFNNNATDILKGEKVLKVLADVTSRVKIQINERQLLEVDFYFGKENQRQIFEQLTLFLRNAQKVIEGK